MKCDRGWRTSLPEKVITLPADSETQAAADSRIKESLLVFRSNTSMVKCRAVEVATAQPARTERKGQRGAIESCSSCTPQVVKCRLVFAVTDTSKSRNDRSRRAMAAPSNRTLLIATALRSLPRLSYLPVCFGSRLLDSTKEVWTRCSAVLLTGANLLAGTRPVTKGCFRKGAESNSTMPDCTYYSMKP